jgi:hypothetical protein
VNDFVEILNSYSPLLKGFSREKVGRGLSVSTLGCVEIIG